MYVYVTCLLFTFVLFVPGEYLYKGSDGTVCKPPHQISALNISLSLMITIITKTFFIQKSHHSYPINQVWGEGGVYVLFQSLMYVLSL